ncbi:hypothetical protein F0562_031686 [Nyssa sinensis]|uniref:Uncharacterized protein n=1 Tax=Nyssa sinensis TaxID=561372 RepID=A0A5J5AYS2_9ASTE|nr:hypothetical protein F0562_031686 [Nyssa sinensis]
MGSRYYFQVIPGDQSPSSGLFRNSSGFQFSSSPLPAGSSGALVPVFQVLPTPSMPFPVFACQRTAGSSGPFSSANSVNAFSSFSACQSTTPASSPTPTGPTNFGFGNYQQKKTNSSSGYRVPISETVVAPAFSFNIASSSVRLSNSPDFPESSPRPPPMDSSEKISPSGHDFAAETTNIPAYLWRPTSGGLALPSLLAMLVLEAWLCHLWRYISATSGGMSLSPLEAQALTSSGWRFWLSSGAMLALEAWLCHLWRHVFATSGGTGSGELWMEILAQLWRYISATSGGPSLPPHRWRTTSEGLPLKAYLWRLSSKWLQKTHPVISGFTPEF